MQYKKILKELYKKNWDQNDIKKIKINILFEKEIANNTRTKIFCQIQTVDWLKTTSLNNLIMKLIGSRRNEKWYHSF